MQVWISPRWPSKQHQALRAEQEGYETVRGMFSLIQHNDTPRIKESTSDDFTTNDLLTSPTATHTAGSILQSEEPEIRGSR